MKIHCGFHFYSGEDDEILLFCAAAKMAGNLLGPWAEKFVLAECVACDPLMNWVRVLAELSRAENPSFPIPADGRYWGKDPDSKVDSSDVGMWLKPPEGDADPYRLHVVLADVVAASVFAIDVLTAEDTPEIVLTQEQEPSDADARHEIEEQLSGNAAALFQSLNRQFGRWVWFDTLRDDNRKWSESHDGASDEVVEKAVKRLRNEISETPYGIEIKKANGSKRAKLDK